MEMSGTVGSSLATQMPSSGSHFYWSSLGALYWLQGVGQKAIVLCASFVSSNLWETGLRYLAAAVQ